MADESLKVDPRQWEAGAEYLNSLRRLGFEPDVLAWGYRNPELTMELLLVTSWIDRVGSKALYDLLFAAYDASATPKEIDPFIVSTYSPKSVLGDQLIGMINRAQNDDRISDKKGAIFILGMGEIMVAATMVYAARAPKQSKVDDLRLFRRFERNVTSLAA